MKIFTFLLVAYVVLCNQVCHFLKTDYYWREYTGEIPDDAIVAGKDINGKNIYIGQAYLKNAGLIVVQITPGVRQVNVPFVGIKKVDKYTKILCGPQEKFYWMEANSSTLHLSLIDKHAVIGGHEDGGYMNVGRISQEGELKIGKVIASGDFYFNNNGNEKLLASYQILMYDDKR